MVGRGSRKISSVSGARSPGYCQSQSRVQPATNPTPTQVNTHHKHNYHFQSAKEAYITVSMAHQGKAGVQGAAQNCKNATITLGLKNVSIFQEYFFFFIFSYVLSDEIRKAQLPRYAGLVESKSIT